MATRRENLIRDAGVGALLVAAIALIGYMAARLGAVGGFRNGHAVTFVFDDATGLVETAPVAASGVKIGVITKIEYAEGGARVTARIDPTVALCADASASVRSKSLLGEKFIALDPGRDTKNPLSGDRVKTTPSADIDRMAAAIAHAVEAIDPKDLKEIAHGMAIALEDADGVGKTMPAAIRDVGRDLHALAESLQGVSAQGNDIANRLKPILTHLDEVAQKSSKELDELDPSIRKMPAMLEKLDRALARIDALANKAEKLDPKEYTHEIRKILEEEGVYVRLKTKKVGIFAPGPEDDDAPSSTPTAKPAQSPPRL